MYLIRRVWECPNSRDTRLVATLATKIAARYQNAGQRSATTVSFNGGTVPGDIGRVYMEWTSEVLESPYRASNESLGDAEGYYTRLAELTDGAWIEFYELMTPDKEVDLEA